MNEFLMLITLVICCMRLSSVRMTCFHSIDTLHEILRRISWGVQHWTMCPTCWPCDAFWVTDSCGWSGAGRSGWWAQGAAGTATDPPGQSRVLLSLMNSEIWPQDRMGRGMRHETCRDADLLGRWMMRASICGCKRWVWPFNARTLRCVGVRD